MVLRTIFELAFIGRNIFTGVHSNSKPQIGKNTVYRFLRSLGHNWRRLIGFLSPIIVTDFLEPLTAADREKVLILATTIYDRSRSSKVELLSRVYDHCAKKYIKGFRMLTLGWLDGVSFVRCDHAVPTSAKEKNLILVNHQDNGPTYLGG